MSRFVFRLQPLLDRYERQERDAYGAVLAAARARMLAFESFDELRAERARVGRAFTVSALESPHIDLRTVFAQLDLIADAIERQSLAVEAARGHEETARERFAIARREHRRLTIMRDRAHAAYLQELAYRESAAIDEANAAQHNAATLFAR